MKMNADVLTWLFNVKSIFHVVLFKHKHSVYICQSRCICCGDQMNGVMFSVSLWTCVAAWWEGDRQFVKAVSDWGDTSWVLGWHACQRPRSRG